MLQTREGLLSDFALSCTSLPDLLKLGGLSMARVVLLGLDGLCPEFLRQWADELPNLMKMQKRGIWGVLESAVPPALPQVWISTQSGRTPDKKVFNWRQG